MARLRSPGKARRLPKGRVNAGVEATYYKRMRLLIQRMHRDTLRTVEAHYRRAGPELAQDSTPDDQPRDRYGRWITEGGTERQALQDRHGELLDRLEGEDANRPVYGGSSWNMPRSGHDTRQDGELRRPLVLGEIGHPTDPSRRVPVTFGEGRQKTSRPDGKGWGRRHIEFKHGKELRDLGFRDALDFAHHVLASRNGDTIKPRRGERNLTITGKGTPDLFEALHLMEEDGHYRVTTAYPILRDDLGKDEARGRGFHSTPLAERNGLAPTVFPATSNKRTGTHGKGRCTPCLALDAKPALILCQDANPLTALRNALAKLRAKWSRIFDDQSEALAEQFIRTGQNDSEGDLRRRLKRAGFGITFRPSANLTRRLKIATEQNVPLIRSIGDQYQDGVTALVTEAVMNGGDLGKLTKELSSRYGVSTRRAAQIAKDQSHKISQGVERERCTELGLKEAYWRHIGGGRHPRADHVAANGRRYFVAEGCLISGEYIQPGQLINCHCRAEYIIPGYND